MRRIIITSLAAASLGLLTAMAEAANDKGHGKGHGKAHGKAHGQAEFHGHDGHAGAKDCPPGLAKKNNGCNPPGQVKHRYGVGDRITGDYILIRDPGLYGLDPYQSYYRVDDYVYLVDEDTREVLDLIGAITALIN